ncbi:sensor domain-containing phosphodiesterase [Paracidovorax wautersii]|uniref:EAL domain, c-di-GMP-specific phosphodiesterase class I (Or its enzymatically inactive variant) n=1 Tax=Paracidovorax wautersii TaxID=1177982 RepID=A0A1I2FCD2_9BURK|nr:EAL domain-containing protein [Paracidovorax wautersii]SFF02559.1 EAL domain, c-di-GMP-specific phosphodiesterase class I (or its enzymatically inactive variant) [Paracidovorax wautersii]
MSAPPGPSPHYTDPLAPFFEHSVGAAGLERVLHAVRRHLSMDVAFVSRFRETDRVLDHLDAEPGCPLRAGQAIPLSQGYCLKVFRGELPAFIPDTSLIPAAMAIPETLAVPIGSHLSVPIVLANQRLFGTLCCFSYQPVATLTERDMDVLRAFAEFLGFHFDAAARSEEQQATVAHDIRMAMAADSLRIVFQPVYGIAQRRIHGFECLARFDAEPRRPPDQWFSAAHAVGLGMELELHAIHKALAALQAFPHDVRLNVNCSPELIISGTLQPLLDDGTDFSRVVLEVTEHAIVNDYAALAQALGPFRARGARLAVDDAGAGYASMRHILNLQPEVIKLDMSITQSIDRDSHRRALAKGLISFAHEIGSQLVAEGVEQAAELDVLSQLGVDFAQGYYLARPLALEEAVWRARDH